MRRLQFASAIFAMLAVGCDGASVSPSPSQLPPTATTTLPSPGPVVPTNAEAIAVGEVVKSQVTVDDPLCDPGWPHRCRYYRLVAPADGVLEVTLRWSAEQPDPYPLDIDVIGASGRAGLLVGVGPGPQRRVTFSVKTGDIRVIEIWSFLSPGAAFELSTTLHGTLVSM